MCSVRVRVCADMRTPCTSYLAVPSHPLPAVKLPFLRNPGQASGRVLLYLPACAFESVDDSHTRWMPL